jgi:flagellar protein FliO/FliZ
MLFIVLALIILAFYLIRKFSRARGAKGRKEDIQILCVHHLSPKEKLVLLDVLGDTLLIGVTPSHISKLSTLNHKQNQPAGTEPPPGVNKKTGFESDKPAADPAFSFQFSDFLAQKLGRKKKIQNNSILKKVPSE